MLKFLGSGWRSLMTRSHLNWIVNRQNLTICSSNLLVWSTTPAQIVVFQRHGWISSWSGKLTAGKGGHHRSISRSSHYITVIVLIIAIAQGCYVIVLILQMLLVHSLAWIPRTEFDEVFSLHICVASTRDNRSSRSCLFGDWTTRQCVASHIDMDGVLVLTMIIHHWLGRSLMMRHDTHWLIEGMMVGSHRFVHTRFKLLEGVFFTLLNGKAELGVSTSYKAAQRLV